MSDSISYQAYEVAALIGEEFNRKRIAQLMGCTERNIQYHVTRIVEIECGENTSSIGRNSDAVVTRFALKNKIIHLSGKCFACGHAINEGGVPDEP